jgi:hypothetical protein
MIRDRGRIKWTAMMLPEHIVQLREWQAEDEMDPEPNLTEDDLHLLQEELENAFNSQNDTIITNWRKGKKYTYIGKITVLDPIHNRISIEGPYGADNIPVSDIVKVQSM